MGQPTKHIRPSFHVTTVKLKSQLFTGGQSNRRQAITRPSTKSRGQQGLFCPPLQQVQFTEFFTPRYRHTASLLHTEWATGELHRVERTTLIGVRCIFLEGLPAKNIRTDHDELRLASQFRLRLNGLHSSLKFQGSLSVVGIGDANEAKKGVVIDIRSGGKSPHFRQTLNLGLAGQRVVENLDVQFALGSQLGWPCLGK